MPLSTDESGPFSGDLWLFLCLIRIGMGPEGARNSFRTVVKVVGIDYEKSGNTTRNPRPGSSHLIHQIQCQALVKLQAVLTTAWHSIGVEAHSTRTDPDRYTSSSRKKLVAVIRTWNSVTRWVCFSGLHWLCIPCLCACVCVKIFVQHFPLPNSWSAFFFLEKRERIEFAATVDKYDRRFKVRSMASFHTNSQNDPIQLTRG